MEAVMNYRGKELPEFSYINTASGLEERLVSTKGKVVILNIWATWCPPCRVEMPELDKLQKAYPDKLSVIAVSDETLDKVREFNQAHPYSFTTAVFSRTNELLNSIDTRPVSILISDGKVKDIVVGARGYSFFSDWFLSSMD
jgi:thiol-disulfide isomerase/thioredoxin